MYLTKGINFNNSKENRKAPTWAEAAVWEMLRGRKFLNLKFRRQHPVQNYILDFFCYELNLAIELDGKYHENEEQLKYDENRTISLNRFGIKVFRLTNEDAINPDIALEKIKNFIESQKAPSPLGEGGDEGL